MKRILCFGDSNTWGYVPSNNLDYKRYPADVRWSGRLRGLLSVAGPAKSAEPVHFEIIEEGLNGRTTAIDEPGRDGRNGHAYLGPCLESHFPLDVVLLMLGTNDLKLKFESSPEQITARIEQCVQLIFEKSKKYNSRPLKLILMPPPIPRLEFIYDQFRYPELETNARKLPQLYRELAAKHQIEFLDVSVVVESSRIDGAHLDADQHEKLAKVIAQKIL